MAVVYALEPDLGVDDYVGVLAETIMRDKRPLANRQRIARMLAGASPIVTARENGGILGLARCISDGAWVCYCAELAVRESAQGRGIGRALLNKCYEVIGPGQSLILMSEPSATGFYEGAGMERHPDAFFHMRSDRS